MKTVTDQPTDRPPTGPDPTAAARARVCPLCWARQGSPCTMATEPDGDHLARYVEAYRHGVISAAVMMAIFEAAEIVTRWRVVPAELAAEAVTA